MEATIIRTATLEDIPSLIALSITAVESSHLADIAKVDKAKAQKIFEHLISASSDPSEGATCPLVAEQGGVIKGSIIGVFGRVYSVLNVWGGTRVFWHVAPDAVADTSMRLLRQTDEWAGKHKGPVLHQASSPLGQDKEQSHEELTRQGYRCAGYIYEKES